MGFTFRDFVQWGFQDSHFMRDPRWVQWRWFDYHTEKKMLKKRVTTRMNITGTEDNTLNNENYQSHRSAQRWTSKFCFSIFWDGKRREQKTMENDECRRQGKEWSSFSKVLPRLPLSLTENKDKRAIVYHPWSAWRLMTKEGGHLGAIFWSPCRATQRSHWESTGSTRSQGWSILVPAGGSDWIVWLMGWQERKTCYSWTAQVLWISRAVWRMDLIH